LAYSFRVKPAAVVLFCLAALPLSGATDIYPCGSVQGGFSIDRRADGHVLLSRMHSRLLFDNYKPAVVTAVKGTKIEIAQDIYLDDEVISPSCQADTVDLGKLGEGKYDVDWAISGFSIIGHFSGTDRTSFAQAANACGGGKELILTARSAGQFVQIDVSQLTRVSDYDAPILQRDGSSFTIQQTEHVNGTASPDIVVCRTRSFLLDVLSPGEYHATIAQRVEDPAGSRTLNETVSFSVDGRRRRGVAH